MFSKLNVENLKTEIYVNKKMRTPKFDEIF